MPCNAHHISHHVPISAPHAYVLRSMQSPHEAPVGSPRTRDPHGHRAKSLCTEYISRCSSRTRPPSELRPRTVNRPPRPARRPCSQQRAPCRKEYNVRKLQCDVSIFPFLSVPDNTFNWWREAAIAVVHDPCTFRATFSCMYCFPIDPSLSCRI